MIHAVATVLIVMLPFSTAAVNCLVACSRCKDKSKPGELLEVYCAMCEECKARRREWVSSPGHSQSTDSRRRAATAQQVSAEDECPTLPPCDSEEQPLSLVEVTTVSTTERTCPPVTPCRKLATTPAPKPCCVPFFVYPYPPMPMCSMCNVPQQPPTNYPLKNLEQVTTVGSTVSSSSGSVYLYIGVPKNINQGGQQ